MDIPVVPAQLVDDLKESHLRYVNDTMPGITRKRYGDGFRYISSSGKVILQKATLDRINDLVIPPAWKNVWISESPTGYLQATGLDDKGRKQYLYHEEWSKLAQENKFGKMTSFGKVLPSLRAKVGRDINNTSFSKEQVLATVVWLLEHTFIRVGNKEYAESNNSYGLTTMRTKHVDVKGSVINFEFRGKSGVEHTINIRHPKIAKIVKHSIELPGYEIFKYYDDSGDRHVVDSADVNEYLKSITGEDVTAKDFRTWGGTVMSASTLYDFGPYQDDKQLKQNLVDTCKEVSKHLGNTPTVCRSYYIHPVVFETYEKHKLCPHFGHTIKSPSRTPQLRADEYAVLTLLEEYA